MSNRKINGGINSALEKYKGKENFKLLEIKAVRHKMWMDGSVQQYIGLSREAKGKTIFAC